MIELGMSSSSSASAASGQGDFNFNPGGNKNSWVPWVVLGAVGIIALVVIFRRRQ